MKPGTLIYLRYPVGEETSTPPQGAFGEVVAAGALSVFIPVGETAVDFPRYKSNTTSGLWRVKISWLVPLGDNGLLSDEDSLDNPYKVEETSKA